MEAIDKFLQVSSGYGYGSGSGYGDGDGDGDGYGSGDGYSSGYGYGSGSGYGDGDGDGDGSGDGYGSGSGSGSGYGDGYGSGSGIEKINGRRIYMIDGTATLIDSVHGNYAKGNILNSDLSLTQCYIARVGDYIAHGETLKAAVRDATAKYERNLPTEERIAKFNAQYPDRDKPIPAKELFDWHNILTGSCLMGRRQWCKDHDIDLNGAYTVNDFISLTRDAYGKDVIRQLEEEQ